MMNILLYAPEYRPNLSNMIRTAEFYGFEKIYIYDDNDLMKPPNNKVSRADMNHMARVWTAGAIEHISIEAIEDILNFLDSFKGRKIATVISDQSVCLSQFTFEKDDLIIMGPEKEGLPKEIMNNSDVTLCIPHRGVTDCLNVSVTLGILINEAFRQLKV